MAGIKPSHGITLDIPGVSSNGRPAPIHTLSAPAYASPLRHHRRHPSTHKEAKETLNAHSEYSDDDGRAQHRINQYIIKEEIGRGSFGAVHLAVDQYGQEYAVKEFSKSRLRKRAQSHVLRRPPGARRPGHSAADSGLNEPLHLHAAANIRRDAGKGNPLYLIREEIAIMKKLNHPNLVSLIEVLDDPEEDSLYMVLEMCKKGVVMKVGLGEKADPYDSERCRLWFRDLILGVEYLHAQGVVHRDIKPDNLLLTEDDVLKVVDFGVSEMFEKESEMLTAKSAGSPAFLPPELCIAKHGDVSGKAADIWSMGISLYCLRHGCIPFEKHGVLELYEAIKNDRLEFAADDDPNYVDLMTRILEKDPKKRITMNELRNHPWVTQDGADTLLSKEENCAELVQPPTESEMNHAITNKMKNLMLVMKAVNKFKRVVARSRPEAMEETLGKGVRIVHSPPLADIQETVGTALRKSRSGDLDDRRPIEGAIAAEGIHREIDLTSFKPELPHVDRLDTAITHTERPSVQHHASSNLHSDKDIPKLGQSATFPMAKQSDKSGHRGHAHDPMDEEPLFLGIGAGGHDSTPASTTPPPQDNIAESPTAAGFNIYDSAYANEVERIRGERGEKTTVYLTRRVDTKKQYKEDENMVEAPGKEEEVGGAHRGWMGVLDQARERSDSGEKEGWDKVKEQVGEHGQRLTDLAAKMSEDARELGTKGGFLVQGVVKKAMEMREDKKGS